MDVAKVESDFRLLGGGIDVSQMSQANVIVLANKIYREVINKIKFYVKEDFFYDYWQVTTTVIGQSEYSLPKRDDDLGVAGCTKLKGVSVMITSNDEDYTKLRPEIQANLDNDLLWYVENQSTADPFYIVADNSYFIYPAPNENIGSGITLYGIADPANLVIGGDEDTIKIPLEYHDILPIGMIYLYYKSRNLIGEKNDALNEYNLYLKNMITELSDRIEVPLESELPNLEYLS